MRDISHAVITGASGPARREESVTASPSAASALTALIEKWRDEARQHEQKAAAFRMVGRVHEGVRRQAEAGHCFGKASQLEAALSVSWGTPAWQPMDSTDWDIVLEALDSAYGGCLADAEAWMGRKREAGYRRDAENVKAVRDKIEAIAAALPPPPEAPAAEPTPSGERER